MATVQRAAGLTPSQVTILKVLSKSSDGLTAHEISHSGKGVPVNSGTIGPVFDSVLHNYPDSLRGRGLVRCEKWEGDEVRWFITEKGRPFAVYKAHKIGPKSRVPNDILDPLAIAFRKTRTYAFEEYTDEDMLEMRSKLPEVYQTVEVEDLRKQIQARRKQGAFADANEKIIKGLKRVIREFGPNGTIIPDFLSEEQMGEIYSKIGGGEEEE